MARKATATASLLSIADISRHFSLPESTTRYYCKRFAAYIPSVGEGRRRRYRRETLEVIAAILEQMQKSRTAAAVEEALQARFARNALAVSPAALTAAPEPPATAFPAAALQLLERQTVAVEAIAAILRLLAERLPAIPQAPAQAQNNTPPQALEQEVAHLRILLEASEKTQQADLEQLRQWMGRALRNRANSE
ncbi:MerR family transcriptional regulator [Desulfovibrio legallii]|jgi:DNA-binding transcriptional MerR regulator|uniref:MerR HTH family regulatory protein n=1 Tax=Desulfovibrio legallii TaxID=571438 RepID=A0A1G7L2C8_9BACT|nr:MerR family transcriptional regulator [Desulfovibrio legallii]SDF43638.1 MerR HTH family regulatory protein [Desulfovibrio legallii]